MKIIDEIVMKIGIVFTVIGVYWLFCGNTTNGLLAIIVGELLDLEIRFRRNR